MAKYKPIEKDYDVKVKVPGVSVIKVTDEKSLQATTLVIGSDLDAIVKTSREQVLVFAQDMKTGRGRPGARVLISDGAAIVLDAAHRRRRRAAQDVGEAARGERGAAVPGRSTAATWPARGWVCPTRWRRA